MSKPLRDLLETAQGIIRNVGEGDWSGQTHQWNREARAFMEKCRAEMAPEKQYEDPMIVREAAGIQVTVKPDPCGIVNHLAKVLEKARFDAPDD